MAPRHPSKEPSQRQRRAGELIRHVLAELFQREAVHGLDLDTRLITVTEVTASPDLRNATVYVTQLGQDDPSAAIETLNAGTSKVRHALGGQIDLKFTPALTFKVDGSFAQAAKIDSLLASAAAEPRRDS